MQSFQMKLRPVMGKKAFTLTEILVVIAIMTILMAAGAIGLNGMNGKGVSSGVATADSLFDEARTTAVGKSIRACVLVAKSLTNHSEDDLKRIIVAYEPLDPTTGLPTTAPDEEPQWVLSSRGAVLPDQTFFSEKLSKKDHAGGSGEIPTVTLSGATKSYEGEYYVYEFNSQGILIDPKDPAFKGGSSFVIGNGTRDLRKPSTSNPPKVTTSSKSDFGGFIIWRSGRTSVFRGPDQISPDIKDYKGGETF